MSVNITQFNGPQLSSVTDTSGNSLAAVLAAAAPGSAMLIGGIDGVGNLRAPTVKNAAPSASDYALVVRQIGTVTVDGSGVTQPVSIAGSIAVTGPLTDTQLRASSISVSGTFFQATQPVSAVSLPLPTGAATAAKQPALGTAGAASADVITVQGVASMTALKVDGSGVTQPVSIASSVTVTGTVTSNIGTTNGLALDATLTAGTAKAVMRGGAKGTTTAADVTSVAVDANTQAFHVNVTNFPASQAVTGTFFQATQPVSATSLPLPTGASTSAKQPTLGVAGTASSDVITVQGIASMTALKVDGSAVTQPVSGTLTANIGTTNGLALDTSVNGILVAQGSATSGQKGPLHMAAVTTAAPTYVTGQTSPLSLTVAGALRMDGSGVTQPVSGTITSNQGAAVALASAWPVKVTDGTNTLPTMDVVGRAGFQKVTDGTNTAAVKAASTPPVAADPALVVAISPNSSQDATTGSTALGALNAAIQIPLAGYGSAGFQLAAGTLIGTIIPEISYDGGTTWVATFFDDPVTGNKVASIIFASSNTLTTRTIIGAGGSSHARVRVSAFTSGTANAIMRASFVQDPSIMYGGAAGSVSPPVVAQIGGKDTSGNLQPHAVTTAGQTIVTQIDGYKATYTGAIRGLLSPTLATDIFTLTGSASKTVRITRVEIAGTQTTGGVIDILAIKRSTANTAGTTSAVTAVPHDSASAAATAVAVGYTANPTVGTPVGNLKASKLFVSAATALGDRLIWDFGNKNDQAIVLRGATQVFAINLNTVTVTVGNFDITITWTEE